MLTIFIRAIIIFSILLFIIRLMGKRQLGEMEPFELVITLVIADIATIPLSDSSLPISYGVVSILTLFVLHSTISLIAGKSLTARKILSGKPTIVIDGDGIKSEALKELSMSACDILQAMRGNGYFSFDEVEYGIMEANGRLSVLPSSQQKTKYLPLSLIEDGKVKNEKLALAKISEQQLSDILAKNNIMSFKDVLIATLDNEGKMYLQPFKSKKIIYTIDGFKGEW